MRVPIVIALLAMVVACHHGPPAGQGHVGSIEIRSAYARLALPDQGSIFFTLQNHGLQADTLLAVRVDGAPAMLHDMREAGGMMVMVPALPRPVNPQAIIQLLPGGSHVMFTVPGAKLAVGDSVRFTLTFARAGRGTVLVPIRGPRDG